jgi:hypothetical protein
MEAVYEPPPSLNIPKEYMYRKPKTALARAIKATAM